MSLGVAFQALISSQPDYLTRLPGRLWADQAAEAEAEPFGVWQLESSESPAGVNSPLPCAVETIQVAFCGPSRAGVVLLERWAAALVNAHVGPQTVGGVTLAFWRAAYRSASAEARQDESDDAARLQVLTITGAYFTED